MKYDVTTPLDLVELLRNADPETRLKFTRRAALLGMSAGVLAGLLAACGGSAPADQHAAAPGTQARPRGRDPDRRRQSTRDRPRRQRRGPRRRHGAPAASAATGGSPTTAASSSGKKPKRGGRS